ncbi:hypothetical protein DMB66_32820 [Actinoplanes sp. ATCC 53533]|nr:hypothetical protein DMB66_32820 [Actinoplanes sp. ATCC 53533]
MSQPPLPVTGAAAVNPTGALAAAAGHRWCGAVVSLLRHPYTAPADLGLAGIVLASLTRQPTDPLALAWAVYAVRATRELCDPDDTRRRTAVTVLARLMQDRGRGDAPAWQEERNTVAGPTGLTASRFALVRALHDRGLCEPALREAHAALHEWTGRDRGRSAIGGIFLLSTVRVLDVCGRIDEARALLDDRRRIPDGDRLRPVVAALAKGLLGDPLTIVDHRNICTWTPAPTGRPRRHSYGQVQRMFLDLFTDDPPTRAPLWPPGGARPTRSRPTPEAGAPSQPPGRAGPGHPHWRSPPGPALSTRRPGSASR